MYLGGAGIFLSRPAKTEPSPSGAEPSQSRSRYTLHWLNGPDRGTAVIYHQTVITVL